MLALINTGSSVNIIREGMLERLRLGKHKLHPNSKRLSGVTGKILNTKGRLSQVPICLDPSKEIQNEVDLLVVTDVTEDLILGQQFCHNISSMSILIETDCGMITFSLSCFMVIILSTK